MDKDIQLLVTAAQQGDKQALEDIIAYAQGYTYNLALRMLQSPMDAEDATQEILVKLITHLGQFRGESAFSTWMYRIASNHLLTMRIRDKEAKRLSFEGISLRIEESLSGYDDTAEEVYESAELSEEVKRSCTLGMVMCLDREDRLALILGELIEVSSEEGALIMDVSAAAYRKRLSRARQTLVTFVGQRCGIINPANPCRCHKHVRNKIQARQLDPALLQYDQPHDAASATAARQATQDDLDQTQRALALLRAHPHYRSRTDFVALVQQVFSTGNPDVS